MKDNVLFKTKHFIALTHIDSDAFSRALESAFPTIRFLLADYGKPWIDEQRVRERSRLRDARQITWDEPWRVMRKPGDEPLPYLASLADATPYEARVWVEPLGWRPAWSETVNKEGVYTITNQPHLQFEFRRSAYVLERQMRALKEPPDVLPKDEILALHCDRMYGRYTREDKEQQAFLRKVWRILEKLTTTDLAWCDRVTLEPKGIVTVKSVWVGFDALEWSRRDKRHYISDGGTYYKPAGCFIPGRKD